jgi:hypothetical protein
MSHWKKASNEDEHRLNHLVDDLWLLTRSEADVPPLTIESVPAKWLGRRNVAPGINFPRVIAA